MPKGIFGSIRHMNDLLDNALAISAVKGAPSWLLTVTANRRWDEIVTEWDYSKTDPNFRFDISNRSFEMRAHCLFSDIIRHQIFGRVEAEFSVNEFQGRGLTHRHLLLIMKKEDTPSCGADIDRLIWAFLPDQNKFPELFSLVSK